MFFFVQKTAENIVGAGGGGVNSSLPTRQVGKVFLARIWTFVAFVRIPECVIYQQQLNVNFRENFFKESKRGITNQNNEFSTEFLISNFKWFLNRFRQNFHPWKLIAL